VAHLLLLAYVVWWNRHVEETNAKLVQAQPPARQVDMVYLSPAPSRKPIQKPRPPAAEREQDTRPATTVTRDPNTEVGTQPTPSLTAPSGAENRKRESGPGKDGEKSEPAAPAREPAPEPLATATMESEALRIFGPKPASGGGPEIEQLVRNGSAGSSSLASNCVPRPHPPRGAGAAPRMGIVTGRIYRRDNGWPLANAHLQMIGTPFVAFTNAQGWYTFRFDADLVEDCRTQMVRVTAPGYRTQWLSVVIAPEVRTSDVLLEPGR
jgi:hypothetical protein